MKFLAALLALIPAPVLALDLTLGVGWCDTALDYCPRPVGKIALTQELYSEGRHTFQVHATHYSEIGDGEPIGGDRGTEFYTIEYKVRLW